MVAPLVCVLLAAPPIRIPPRPRGGPVLPPLTASIHLAVKAGGTETMAAVKPGQAPPAARPLVSMKAGEKPQIRWTVRNTDPKKPVPEVVIHFLVTSQERPGASIPAAPQKGSLTDSVVGTELARGGTSTGNFNTPIHQPGIYLVEVELLDAFGNRRLYSAVDLKVE